MRVLLSWVGAQDPWKPIGGRTTGKLNRFGVDRPADVADGPILSFLSSAEPFHTLYLLCDPRIEGTGAVEALSEHLRLSHPHLKVYVKRLPIEDPRSYDPLYRHMRAVCETAAELHGPTADYNIFLSPGTPQMHAVWVLLCKTVFPATAWQASDQAGQARAEIARIPFDIEAEIVEPTRRDAAATPPDIKSTGFVYASSHTGKMLETLLRAARRSALPILILGERGTGKEKLARLVHQEWRPSGPFVPLNCACIAENLVESELFGHRRGAFTGADADKPGLFETAQRGTVFLDEIAELPLPMQNKLLRVLQEKSVRRLGTDREMPVDFRLVAATNRDLRAMAAQGQFRPDLYDRINGVTIQVSPLRERVEDLPPLIDHFLQLANKASNSRPNCTVRLAPNARAVLLRHSWPGNARELENTIGRLVALSEGPTIKASDVRQAISQSCARPVTLANIDADLRPGRDIDSVLADVERELLRQAKHKYGTQTRIGAAFGITQQAVSERQKRLGLTP